MHGGAAQLPVASGIDGIHQRCGHHHRTVATRSIGRTVVTEQRTLPRGHRPYPGQYGSNAPGFANVWFVFPDDHAGLEAFRAETSGRTDRRDTGHGCELFGWL